MLMQVIQLARELAELHQQRQAEMLQELNRQQAKALAHEQGRQVHKLRKAGLCSAMWKLPTTITTTFTILVSASSSSCKSHHHVLRTSAVIPTAAGWPLLLMLSCQRCGSSCTSSRQLHCHKGSQTQLQIATGVYTVQEVGLHWHCRLSGRFELDSMRIMMYSSAYSHQWYAAL
jgi:hypothetical protein